MDLQQSPLYLEYVRRLGWRTETIDGVSMIYRYIFILGGLAKIQRCNALPDPKKVISILGQNHIKTLAIEPAASIPQKDFSTFCERIKEKIKLNTSPFLPTKTIVVDLTHPQEALFTNFTQAKRRAVRRAQKHHITVEESNNIVAMIKIKAKSAGLFGSITTYGLRELWETFEPTHAAILLARHDSEIVGGVFLIFWEKKAYYWIVGATKKGKTLFAPTLLVWEALKLSKIRGCNTFDLVGVWDERLPHQNKEWIGFTKFKEGFGGVYKYYPIFKNL